jgi:hypothetical protein
MGYTTKFTGSVSLSRALTIAEARILLEANEDNDATKALFGRNNYLQWVPTESLDAIVWDGNEKFYDYIDLMGDVCAWLKARDITANGELSWAGESADDRGTLTVKDNEVTADKGATAKKRAGKPLSLSKLAEMALDQVTGG